MARAASLGGTLPKTSCSSTTRQRKVQLLNSFGCGPIRKLQGRTRLQVLVVIPLESYKDGHGNGTHGNGTHDDDNEHILTSFVFVLSTEGNLY